MKKQMKAIACMVSMLFSCGLAFSQSAVENYEFSSEVTGEYTSLENDATVLAASESVSGAAYKTTFFNATEKLDYTGSETSMTGIPIGFDFMFDGDVCDKFVVSGAGFVLLGTEAEAQVRLPANSASDFTDGWPYKIGIGTDGSNYGIEGQTKVRYALQGEDGNRVLAVEFVGMSFDDETGEDGTFSYQVKLYEADNHVEILFDEYTVSSWGYSWWGLGIEGKNGNHYRSPSGGSWTNSDRWGGMAVGTGTSFEKGLLYAFFSAKECTMPAEGILGFEFVERGVDIEVKGNVVAGTADAYVVFRFPVSSMEETVPGGRPDAGIQANGVSYKVGDSLGSGVCVAQGDLLPDEVSFYFADERLQPDTIYCYAGYLYNYKCSGGPVYGYRKLGHVRTGILPPVSLHVVSVDGGFIRLEVDAHEAYDSVLVAVTEIPQTDQVGMPLAQGDFGRPSADAAEGDALLKEDGSEAGRVVFIGPASDDISYEYAKGNEIYHFAVFSKKGEAYSYKYATVDTVSPATLPFNEDFSDMPQGMPVGWNGTQGFNVVYDTGAGRNDCRAVFMNSYGTPMQQEAVLVLPAMDFPDTDVRLLMDWNLHFFIYGDKADIRQGVEPEDWGENDSVVVEISTDGGASYRQVALINGTNAGTFVSGDLKPQTVDLEGFAGLEQALVRVRLVSSQLSLNNELRMVLGRVQVFPIPECDYPAFVTVVDTSVWGSHAYVDWTSGRSGEDMWNVSYAMQEEDGTWSEWSPSVLVDEKGLLLDGLESSTVYKARVQALCAIGQVSDYVESASFRSGWTMPFAEDFNHLEMTGEVTKILVLPGGWENRFWSHDGSLPDSVDWNDCREVWPSVYDWKTTEDVVPGSSNGSLGFEMMFTTGTSIIRLPQVEVSGEGSPKVVFDAAFGYTSGKDFSLSEEDAYEDYHMYVWVQEGNDGVYDSEDILQEWNPEELLALGDSTRIELDLAGYEGRVTVSLGVTGSYSGLNQMLYVDNLGLLYDCPKAMRLAVEEGSLTETSAVVCWREDPVRDSWLLVLEGDGEIREFEVQGNRYELTGLAPAISYVLKVGQECAQESEWSSLSFTTAGGECAEVSEVEVSGIGNCSAVLTWKGTADAYRVRIRPVQTEEWVLFDVSEPRLVWNNLLDSTAYEGGIQALCNEMAGDTSSYVSFETFMTREITCFAPTDLQVSEVGTYSAKVSWTGESTYYQLECVEEAVSGLAALLFVEGESCVVEGLQPATAYRVRVRGICGEGDTSSYSVIRSFTTKALPACPAPADLTVSSITSSSARLSWTCQEEDALFVLRFRESAGPEFDSVRDIEDLYYDLTGLQPETSYLWSVMTACAAGNYSGWSTHVRFDTDPVSNEADAAADLFVTASKGQVHLMNPAAMQVDRVCLYDVDGSLLAEYPVHGNQNVILTTSLSQQVVVVRVAAGGSFPAFKIFIP